MHSELTLPHYNVMLTANESRTSAMTMGNKGRANVQCDAISCQQMLPETKQGKGKEISPYRPQIPASQHPQP
jgi:hypothetical protein